MATPVTTTLQAYKLARKLCDDYDLRKLKEEDQKTKREKVRAAKPEKPESADGPSRTVTQIDYKKHERTVEELQRQEKEEEYQKKMQNARPPPGGCSHDHQKEWAIYEKSTQEKVKAADRFRQEGNEAYRKHNYGLAAVHYRKALLQFDYTFAEGEDEEKLVDSVKLPCLLNLAACKCQQEEWDEVLTHCRLALEVNPRSVKAFYRTGLAHLARDQFEEARDALMSAYEIEPKNAEVLHALARLKKNVETYRTRRKEVSQAMVSGAPGDEHEDQTTKQEPAVGSQDGAESSPEVAARPKEESQDAKPADVISADSQLVTEPVAQPQEDSSDEEVPITLRGSAVSESEQSPCEEPPPSPGAATEDADIGPTVAEGLRQRRPPRDAPKDQDDDAEVDADEEGGMDMNQRQMLNMILLVAGGLAVTAVGVCVFAYWADQSSG